MAEGAAEGTTVTPGAPKREEWSSRAAFYFAAVGAAVGFGESQQGQQPQL